MKEAFENTEEKPREKIKVTKADIIVTGTKKKPYFEIKYKEVGKKHYNIGYSSYDLNNVFKWREEEMEIVSEVEAEYGNGWIPCNRADHPYDGQRVLACINTRIATHEIIITDYNGEIYWFDGTISAWMPLPEPYKPGEGE